MMTNDPRETGFFLVTYDIGSNYLRDHPLSEQIGFAEHAKYMDLLHTAGKLLFGGLLLNHVETSSVTGGALLVRACSPREAHDVAMQDPAVKNSLFQIKDVKHFVGMIGQSPKAAHTNDTCLTEQWAPSP